MLFCSYFHAVWKNVTRNSMISMIQVLCPKRHARKPCSRPKTQLLKPMQRFYELSPQENALALPEFSEISTAAPQTPKPHRARPIIAMNTLTTVKEIFFQLAVSCFLFIMSHQAAGRIIENQVQNRAPKRPSNWLNTGMAFAMIQATTQRMMVRPYQLPRDLKLFSFMTLVLRQMRT
jgi:hypothetical protein